MYRMCSFGLTHRSPNNRQWPGGVGTDELYLSPFPCADPASTILSPRPQDLGNHLLPKAFGEEEVEVTGPPHLDAVHDERIQIEAMLKELGNVPRLATEGTGQGKGNGCGQIAKGGLDGVLPDDLALVNR